MDTDETVRVLRTLDDDDGVPTRVELDHLLHLGHRRLWARRAIAGALTAVAVLAVAAGIPSALGLLRQTVAPAVSGTATCQETVLPLPTGSNSGAVEAADPTGRYAAGPVGAADIKALWTGGRLATTFAVHGAMVSITDVSSTGAIIGTGTPAASGRYGWIFAHGALSWLNSQPNTLPLSINARGMIVGAHGYPGSTYQPVVWSSPTADPVALALPSGFTWGMADGVDDDGTIVGNISAVPNVSTRVVIWGSDRRPIVLPFPAAVPGAVAMGVVSIRNGVLTAIVADLSPYGEHDVAVTYRVATGRYTVLPGTGGYAGGIIQPAPSQPPTAWTKLPTAVLKAGRWSIADADGNGGMVAQVTTGNMVDVPSIYTPSGGRLGLPTLATMTPSSPPASGRPTPSSSASGRAATGQPSSQPGSGQPDLIVFYVQPVTISNGGHILAGKDIQDGMPVPVRWICH